MGGVYYGARDSSVQVAHSQPRLTWVQGAMRALGRGIGCSRIRVLGLQLSFLPPRSSQSSPLGVTQSLKDWQGVVSTKPAGVACSSEQRALAIDSPKSAKNRCSY